MSIQSFTYKKNKQGVEDIRQLLRFAWGMTKHSFPLPMINQLMDPTIRHELLTSMDENSRYNQILKHVLDQEYNCLVIDLGL